MGFKSLGRLTFASAVFLLLSFVSSLTAVAQDGDPGAADTIRISCIHLTTIPPAGDSIGIQIHIYNDEEIGAFALGFHYDSDLIEFSTWKEGPSIPAGGIHQQTVRDAENQVLLGWITFNPVGRIIPTPGGARLLATMYFKILPGAVPAVIDLDSTYVPPAGIFVLSKGFGGNIFPQYRDCGGEDVILGSTDFCTGPFVCGDVDRSQQLNIADAVYLINYIFASGPIAQDGGRGDLDCSHRTDITDIVFLINYMFAGGPSPCLGCYESPILDSLKSYPEVIEPGRIAHIRAFAYEPTGALLRYTFKIGDWSVSGYSGNASWNAPSTEGSYLLNFAVSDGCDSVTIERMVTVQRVSPVIQVFKADHEVVLPNASTNLHVGAIDPDGDNLTFEFRVTGGSISGDDSTAVWHAPALNGIYYLTVIVSDGVYSDTSTIDLEVSSSPILDSIRFLPETLYVNSEVVVVAEAFDPTGAPLNYHFYVNVGSVSQNNSDTARWSLPDYATEGQLTVLVSNAHESVQKTITRDIVFRPTTIQGTLTLSNTTAYSLAGTTISVYSSINNWANHVPSYLRLVALDGLSASFEFVGINAGTYYIDAWKDADLNNLITPGDLFGWYGIGAYPLGSLIPVTISESQEVTVDIAVYHY